MTWTASLANGSPVTSYTVTPFAGSIAGTPMSVSGTSTSATVSGLINGTTYTLQVTATNSVGTGPAGTSNAIAPTGTPAAPTNVQASPGNGQATVTWTAPASNGGSSIATYTVTPYIGATAQTSTTIPAPATSTTITGFTNGTAYTFKVAATNSNGTGPASAASSAVTPATVPGAPTGVAATSGNSQATVTWTAPSSNGGAAVTSYTVTPFIGSTAGTSSTVSGTTTTTTITGLTNGTAYTFQVTATNSAGTGAPGTSPSVTPATAPGAPTGVLATAGNAQAVVSWTAPPSNGGAAITSYTVTPYVGTTAQATTSAAGTAISVTVSGLTNGTAYTFTVTATNTVGNGPASTGSFAVTPATVPGAPTIVTASAGNAQATVNWNPPASNGGSTLTGYTITPYVGTTAGTPSTVGASVTSVTINGLTNGTTYTLQVYATNAVGNGPAGTSSTVTPATVPSQPSSVTATAGNQQATVNWSAPANNGGATVTGYTVTPYIGGTAGSPTSVTASSSSATISGLTNGTAYTFQVYASNSAGNGAAATSNSATPATIPGTPTNVAATGGSAQAAVTWTPPGDNGGAAIIGYTVTPYIGATAQSPTAVAGAVTSAIITGLANGTAYTFTVTATNSVGAGPASAPSSAVTPATVPGTPTVVTGTAGIGQATVTWNPPATDGGSAITGYTVTPYVGATAGTPTTVAASVTSTTIGGLTTGTTYTFQVFATNGVGNGAPWISNAVTIVTVPTAPGNLTATAADKAATVTWSVPSSDGGAAITGYTVTPFVGTTAGTTTTVSASTISTTIIGLINGTSYTFQVYATNSVGNGASGTSNAVTPAAMPGPPTSVTATIGDTQSTVNWAPPADNGGAPIASYTLTPYIGNTPGTPVTTTGPVTSQVMTGLTNGTTYSIFVTATNSLGTGPAGVSNPVTPSGVPGAPLSVTAVAGNQQATVIWTAPPSNGTLLQTYTVTSLVGTTAFSSTTVTAGVTSVVMTGLTNGTPYTFTVTASNSAGQSPVGTSPSVTPATLPDVPGGIGATSGNATATVSWAVPNGNGSAVTSYTVTPYAGSTAGSPVSTTSTSTTIIGLTNGTVYTFQVTATNAIGTSGAGSSSPVLVGTTAPPSGVAATSASANQATVTWTAAAGGASAPTGYLVTAYLGSQVQRAFATTATSATLTGLSAGSYTFRVLAQNTTGSSPASLPSSQLVISGSASTYASTVVADGPSIYYRLDESSGTLAADSSGNGRAATYGGGYTLGAAGALVNDSNPGVSLSSGFVWQQGIGTGLPSGNAARSLEAWFKTTSTGPIVRYGAGDTRKLFDLKVSAGNQLQIVAYNDDHTFLTPHWVADGVWHHVVATYNPANVLTVYLDGASLGTASFSATLNTQTPQMDANASGLVVGNDYWNWFNSSIDEVAVYPYVLTAAQVASHFNASGNFAPTAPTGVTASSTVANQATVSWAASSTSAGAPVSAYIVTAFAGTKAQTSLAVSGTTTTATVTGLKSGTTYTFQVMATNYYGNSPFSASSSAVTPSGYASTYASTVQGDGPSIYYRLDESSGTVAADSSGNGRLGGYGAGGGGAYSLGAGGALVNDIDPGVSLSSALVGQANPGAGLPTGNAARSLEAWFKSTSGSPGPIMEYGFGNIKQLFDLRLPAPNQLQLSTYNEGVIFITPRGVTDGLWHYVVATYDPSNVLTMYLDGISLGSQSFNGTLNTTTPQMLPGSNGLVIGNDPWAWYSGSVDEVAVYPFVMTAAQVANHFSASGNSRPTAPTALTANSTVANQATVSWTASSTSAGAPVSVYIVTAFAGTKAQTSLAISGTTTTATVTGLKSGTAYTFQVMATNNFGSSPWSAASSTLTPSGSASTYASTIQADGPSIYYRLDETTGTVAADSSGNGRAGGYGSNYALGAAGGLINDSDSAVSLPSGFVSQISPGPGLPSGNAARSLEAWFKSTSTGPIVRYGAGDTRKLFDLKVSSGNQLQVVAYNDDHTFATLHAVTDGVWHHVVATYDPANVLTMYLDGSALGTSSFNATLNTQTPQMDANASGLVIGNDQWGWFNSTVDDVAVYPYVLSAAQVASHFSVSGNATLPSPPGLVTAVGGNGQAQVAWNPSSGNGGTVAGYTVTPFVGAVGGAPQQVAPAVTSATVTGLTNGTTYTFQVTATSNLGTSQPGTSNPLTVGAPGAPTSVSATGGSAQATVTWTAAAGNASAISSYTVTPYIGTTGGTPTTVTGAPPPTTSVIGGLTNGTTYTFAVTATNASGQGPAATSNAAIPGLPGAPTNVTATIPATNNTANVSWGPAALNGVAITGYVVTAVPGGGSLRNAVAVAPSATNATIGGLVSGSSYMFQVIATTASGNGPMATSAAVTPTGSAATYASTVLGDGPLVYYRLGDPAGSIAADSSGSSSPGTYSGGFALGAVGSAPNDSDTAVSINGGQVQNPSPPVPIRNAARTLEAWVKTTGGGSAVQGLVGYGSPNTRGMFDLRLYGTSQIGIVGYGDDHYFTAANPITNGSWHQVVATYDGSVVTVYLDGQSLGTASFGDSLATVPDANGLILGRDSWWSGDWLNGSLDEVAVYGSALSAAQVAAHFSASANAGLSAPGAVAATPGSNQATVTWSAPSGTVNGYRVTAYNGSVAQNSQSLTAAATSTVITGLQAGIAYTLQVVAYGGFGPSPAGVSSAITPGGTNQTYASTVLGDAPREYYRLGDAWGTVAADSSGNNQQGSYGAGYYSLSGASALTNDTDKSLYVNGGEVTAPDVTLTTGNGSRTIEAWVNTTNGSGVQAIAGYGTPITRGLFDLRLYNSNVIGLVTWNDDHYFTASHPLTNGQWHQVVAAYDGPSQTLKLYVDGTVIGQATLADALGTATNGGGLVIGQDSWQLREGLVGSVDDVSVYGSALSAAQVAAHFQASGNSAPAAPTAVIATPGSNQATVSWTPPAGTVTGYVVTASTGGLSQNATAVGNVTNVSMSGLSLGAAYTFQVVATNNFGNSPPSVASAPVTITAGSSSGYAATVLGDGPVEYYRLDDATGPVAADSSGNNQLGTYSGSYSLGGASALLNDADKSAYVNGGNMTAPETLLPTGNAPRTIEAWVNTNQTGTEGIAGYGSTATRSMFALRLNGTNQVGVVTYGDDKYFTAGYALGNGVWHQVVATYDGTTVIVYVDGQSIGQSTFAGALGTQLSGSGLQLAKDYWGDGLTGSLDDVSTYAKALTAAQVANHWAAAAYRRPSAPIDPQATAGPQGAIVSWTAPADLGNPPLTGYTITPFAGSTPGTPISAGPNLTSVMMTGLTAGTSYSYQVKADAIYDPPLASTTAISAALALAPVPANSAYVLEVAYADTGHPYVNSLPGFWQGAPNTIFIGTSGPLESGALRIHDLTGAGLTLNDVTVDVGPYHFANIWGNNIAVPAGGDLILTGTASAGLDTSETPVGSCTQSGYIPVIHATVNNFHVDWRDFGQVLNSGGTDLGDCTFPPSEFHDWSVVHNGPLPTEIMGPNGSMKLCWACMGLPVNTASGDFWHSFTDFDIPGRGFNLHFDRTYNSQAAPYDGPLGYGWSDPYNMFLSYNSASPTSDPAGGTVVVHQESGSTANFTPNGNAYVPAPNILATLVHNADGTFTFSRTDLAKYTFNARGELVSEADRNGYTTTFTYNASDQLAAVTEPAGRTLSFTYNGTHISQITDNTGNRSVSFTYDGVGNLVKATDVGGASTTFTYDPSHLMLSMTDPNGGVVTNVYDSSGQVTRQTDAMGRVMWFSYAPGKTTTTDPNGNQTVDVYQNGQLMQETKAFGTLQAATWFYSYDPISAGVATVKDPSGNVTTNTWDANGNLLTKTDALSQVSSYTYNGFNEVLTAKDPIGTVTTNTYDASGNLTQTSTPLTGTAQTAVTGFGYDPSHPGDLTSMTDANQKTWQYRYDLYGIRARSQDPLGDIATYSYDGVGRLQSTVSPRGNVLGGNPATYTTNFTFNAYGDRLSAIDPLGHATTYQYDANRNATVVSDANNKQTTTVFDADNEPIKVVRPDGTTLKTVYDGDGNVLQQIDGLGNATVYAYNGLNQRTRMTDPLLRATQYGFDGVGNLLTVQNPKDATVSYTMGYDVVNQLKSITYSDGVTPNVAYQYDADGQRKQMTDGTGTTTYTFDSLHRLTQNTNGANAQVQYGYDLLGHVTQLVYPGGVNAVNRTYDDAGRLASVSDWLSHTTRFGFDPNSNLTSQTYPNGVVAGLTYDAADRLIQITDAAGSNQLLNLTYARDASNKLTAENAMAYGYDANNRVTASSGGGSSGYAYDAADNLTRITGTYSTTQVYDAANQLQTATTLSGPTQVQKYTYGYDANGNRTSRTDQSNAVTNYGWDQANRLTGYGTTATYKYNGDGLRTSKAVSGSTQPFVWDTAEGLPLTIQDGTTSYVTGLGGLPLEQVAGSAVTYYHGDQLGSTRALSNSSGAVVASYNFDAYGNPMGTPPAFANPFGFTGQYSDGESGWIFLRARYDDPGSGQFITRDPLTAVTHAPYAYTSDNPLNATDPAGLCSGFDPGCWASSVWAWGTAPRQELQPLGDAAEGVAGYVDLLTAGSYGNGLNAMAGRTVVDSHDCNYQYGRGVGKQITNLGILIRFGGEVFDTDNPKPIIGKPGTRVPTPLPEPPRRTAWGLVFELFKSVIGHWAEHH